MTEVDAQAVHPSTRRADAKNPDPVLQPFQKMQCTSNTPRFLAGRGSILLEQCSAGVPKRIWKTDSVISLKYSAAATDPLELSTARLCGTIGTSWNMESPC